MEESYTGRYNAFAEIWAGHEGADIAKLLVAAGERLAALCLEDPAVDGAMSTLHKGLHLGDFPNDYDGPRDWRTLWSKFSDGGIETMPLSQRVTSLHAYAFWGLSPRDQDGPCLIDDIKAAIEGVKSALGHATKLPETPELDRTILAAEGRLAFDEGGAVPLEHLAALAGIGVKSVRNAASPSSGSGLEVRNGTATPESAVRWLISRNEFKSSIWDRAGEDDKREESSGQVEREEGETLWVPFAKDGSEFHPQTCLRGGKYAIGPKGNERLFDDYREALQELARMRPTAYWRRPNSAGNWGIVTAEGFRPRTPAKIRLAEGGK